VAATEDANRRDAGHSRRLSHVTGVSLAPRQSVSRGHGCSRVLAGETEDDVHGPLSTIVQAKCPCSSRRIDIQFLYVRDLHLLTADSKDAEAPRRERNMPTATISRRDSRHDGHRRTLARACVRSRANSHAGGKP
jgi:hypothetical protein